MMSLFSLWCILLAFHLANARQDIRIKTVRVGCDKVPSHSIATRLPNCKTRLDIDLKITDINKQAKTNTDFIAVERVFDDLLQKEVRLLTPVLIKIWQENVTLVYPLETVAIINNKAYEVIIHKDNVDNFTGCADDAPQKHTCGHHVQDGKPISHGFCCHCDSSLDNQPYHGRGGQDCSNEYVAKMMNRNQYLSSAHCLRFDPVWYSIKDLKSPRMHHSVYASVYVEEIDQSGKRSWVDMTGRIDIGVSTHKTSHLSDNGKVFASYVEHGERNPTGPLNINQQHILIPQASPSLTHSTPLQLKGDAMEFLVLDSNDISVSGKLCDKVGVSYQAFTSQLFKCHKAAQSCLDKQPMHYWLHDIEKSLQRRKGKYFLGNIAKPADPAIVQHVGIEEEWLRLKYNGQYHAHLYLQLNADHIFILPRGLNASIDEVHFSSNMTGDSISVYVQNSGRLSASFSVLINSCSNSRIVHMRTKLAVIGPRCSTTFELRFGHVAPTQNHIGVTCHVTVLSSDNKTVAGRKIVFRLEEQCFCIGECECSCTSTFNTQCSLGPKQGILSKDMYHKAHGIFTSLGDYRFIICCVLVFIMFIGILKAIIGLIAPVSVGQKGTCLFIEKKPLASYHEKSLKDRKVIYNENQIPVHPDTMEPVQILPRWQIGLINMFFCFYLSFGWICWLWKKCHSKETTDFTPIQEFDSSEEFNIERTPSELLARKYSLTEVEKRKAIAQYKKQKYEMTKLQQLNASAPKVLATHELSPEDNEEVKKDRNVRRFFTKDSILQLLRKEFVYFNYTDISPFLKNSGSQFSMCGKLERECRRYRFHLNGYDMQTHENDHGIPKQLKDQRRIVHPKIFSQLMTISGVYQCVSEQPEYPCLN